MNFDSAAAVENTYDMENSYRTENGYRTEKGYSYEDLDISVVQFSKGPLPGSWRTGRTYAETHDLVYVAEGRAVCFINEKTYRLSKGNVLYIPQGASRQICMEKQKDLISYVLKFQCHGRDERRGLPIPPVTDSKSSFDLSSLFKEMEQTWDTKAKGYRMMAKAIALMILHELLFRTYQEEQGTMNSNRVEAIKEYIYQNYQNDIQIEDIANILNLNPVYLGAYFKKKTGYSIRQYINHVRVSKAKGMLSSSGYSVGEVAQQCGYQDIYYFSKVFKQIEGVPPSYLIK